MPPAIAVPPMHTISLLVRNKPGVLCRIALVFSRRGYNIESLVVSPGLTTPGEVDGLPAQPGEFSRMTITCWGESTTLEQIIKQLEKLIDVVHAIDHTGQAVIDSELALAKVKVSLTERTAVLQVAENFKAKVVDYGSESVVLRCAGETEKIDAFVALLKPFGIVELVRSGKILMMRGLEKT